MRDKAIHLGIDGNGSLVAVDSHVLPFLQDLAETLGERLGGFGNYLPAKTLPTVLQITALSLSP